jgi:molecular chaperone Hsp33
MRFDVKFSFSIDMYKKEEVYMSYILRGTAGENSDIRFFAAITTDLVEKARKIHNLSPTASAALGRLLSAGVIMGCMLKGEEDNLTISLNGGGPIGNVMVSANSKGNIKGYVSNPQIDLPLNSKGKLDVGGAVGTNGTLNVIKDIGLKEPYVGQVPIKSGEIGDDLAYYFAISEQIPSAVDVGVLVDTDLSIKAAGSLIIQMMPDADPYLADIVTYRIKEIPPLTTLISDGKTAKDILNMLFDDMNLKILEKIDADYVCDCSKERVERALISLGKDELKKIKDQDLKDNNEKLEVCCHFCSNKYYFNRKDIERLIEES